MTSLFDPSQRVEKKPSHTLTKYNYIDELKRKHMINVLYVTKQEIKVKYTETQITHREHLSYINLVKTKINKTVRDRKLTSQSR